MNSRKIKFLSYLLKQNGTPIKLSEETCNVVSSLGVKDLNELYDDLMIVNDRADYISLTTDGFKEVLKAGLTTWNAEAMRMIQVLDEDGQVCYINTPTGGYWKAL